MKQIAIIFAILLIIPAVSMAVENDGYVVNVMAGGEFVKEIDGTAYIVFDSEYKLLLKNNTDKMCSARVFIDGARVSPGGDFVIHARDELLLERFVADLDSGKRFKFVPLSNPEVDDPTRKENGVVRVEFRRESVPKYEIHINGKKIGEYRADDKLTVTGIKSESKESLRIDEIKRCNFYFGLDGGFITDSNVIYTSDGTDWNMEYDTSASNGATIAGSKSTQQFHKVDYDFEESFVEVRLMMNGLSSTPIDGYILRSDQNGTPMWTEP